MFTGLVEDVAKCLWVRRTAEATQLTVTSSGYFKDIRTGDSIAVNGCCLTVTAHRKEQISFELLEETLERTNLRHLRPDSSINLERALPANGRMGGHFVQGHVDCTAKLLSKSERGGDLKMTFELPAEFARYVVWKGSICINGVSLTVAELTDDSFSVWIIPHTRANTNLRKLHTNDEVNLEFDILAKYAERILTYGTADVAEKFAPRQNP